MYKTIELKDAVKTVIERHGGVRPAARALNMDHAYLSRLFYGDKENPSDAVLRRLGLRRRTVYEVLT